MLTLRQSLENEPDVPALVLHGNARFKKVAKKIEAIGLYCAIKIARRFVGQIRPMVDNAFRDLKLSRPYRDL